MEWTTIPEQRYDAAIAMITDGDEVGARRTVEDGLAHATGPRARAVRECLEDLASQLDGEAALQRLAKRTPGPRGWLADPGALARSVMCLGRAHLVEAVIEEIADLLPEPDLIVLVGALARAGGAECRDMLVACGAVLEGAAAVACRRACPDAASGGSPIARALAHPVIAAAWGTAPAQAPDQRQVVVAVGREAGRVAPLVALIDHDDLGATLRDAFFLPDMVPARLAREVLVPMATAGVPATPLRVDDALEATRDALGASLALGRRLPSEDHQAVVARMRRIWGGIPGSSRHVEPRA